MLGRRGKGTRTVGREQLVATAAEIALSEGFLALSDQRLADAVGVPPSSIDDLDQLIAETYRSVSGSELRSVHRRILADPSPAAQMRALLNWLGAESMEAIDAGRIEGYALARRNPALQEAIRENEAAWLELVTSVIRRGARRGDFRESDAEEVAAHLLTLADGISAYQLVGYRSDADWRSILTRVVRAELGLVWGQTLEDALA